MPSKQYTGWAFSYATLSAATQGRLAYNMATGQHDTIAYRLSHILIKLNQGDHLDPAELADEFSTHVRTIQRNLMKAITEIVLKKIFLGENDQPLLKNCRRDFHSQFLPLKYFMNCKIVIQIFFIYLLAGCTVITDKNLRKFDTIIEVPETINHPNNNIETVAEVGESLIRKEHRIKTPVLSNSKITPFLIDAFNKEAKLPQGQFILRKKDINGLLYVMDDPAADLSGKINPKLKYGIYVPNQISAPKEGCLLTDELGAFCGPLSHNIFTETSREQSFPEAFRRELIYMGKSKDSITMIYREFKNDMIRPAFSQEMRYDLSEGKIIGYKGSRFEVINADNLGIRYKVMRPLD